MKYLFLFFVPALAYAQGKAAFFPVLTGGSVVEEKLLDKSIERNVEVKGDLHRIVINYWNTSPIQYSVAHPVGIVSQYATCARQSKAVLSVDNQYEQNHLELRFKCVTPAGDYDPTRVGKVMGLRYCTDILSPAQAEVCKHAGLK